MQAPPHVGAMVLAGGRSTRMGAPKALLDWHGGTLVRRVSGILQRVADPVVVVHANRIVTDQRRIVEKAVIRPFASESRGALPGCLVQSSHYQRLLIPYCYTRAGDAASRGRWRPTRT